MFLAPPRDFNLSKLEFHLLQVFIVFLNSQVGKVGAALIHRLQVRQHYSSILEILDRRISIKCLLIEEEKTLDTLHYYSNY